MKFFKEYLIETRRSEKGKIDSGIYMQRTKDPRMKGQIKVDRFFFGELTQEYQTFYNEVTKAQKQIIKNDKNLERVVTIFVKHL